MKKLLIGMLTCATAFASFAEDVDYSTILSQDITAANKDGVIAYCMATTNYTRLVNGVRLKKLTAVEVASLDVPASVINSLVKIDKSFSTIAAYLARVDVSKLSKDDRKFLYFAIDFGKFNLITTEGLAAVKEITAKNKVLGNTLAIRGLAEIKKIKDALPENIAYAETAYASLSPAELLADENATMIEWISYAEVAKAKKEYDVVEALYVSPRFWTIDYRFAAFTQQDNTGPLKDLGIKARADYLAWACANEQKNIGVMMVIAKMQDAALGNTKTTESIYKYVTKSCNKLNLALYLKDNDKMIDVLVNTDMSLTPMLINKAIVQLNGLSPDYKPAKVLLALKAVNQRYTLKLYDDRDTWEPVLSKLRAMIDCRN